MSPSPVVVYLRRSTNKNQKHSLDAQLASIEQFCKENSFKILKVFRETCSGATTDRPEFQEALRFAQRKKAPIIVKSLDRLGRNAEEVISLFSSEQFIVSDLGLNCDPSIIQSLAIYAQYERETISKRTKEGLKAAKAKGIQLGNPDLKKARVKAVKKTKQQADEFALSLHELFALNKGLSLSEQAKKLNQWNIPTRQGKQWTAQAIKNLQTRLKRLCKEEKLDDKK